MRNILAATMTMFLLCTATSSTAQAQLYYPQPFGGMISDITNLAVDSSGRLTPTRRVQCDVHCLYYEGLGSTTEQWEQCLAKVKRLCKGLECNAMTVHASLSSDPQIGAITTVVPCP